MDDRYRFVEGDGQIPVPPDPSWVELSVDGRKAYVVNRGANLITVLDPASGKITGQVPVGPPRCRRGEPPAAATGCRQLQRHSVTLLDASTDTVTTTIPVGQHPQAVAWAADGRFLYVVNDGDNTISTIDPGTGKITATVPTAQTPTSISVLPDGTRAYVTNLTSGTLTSLDLTD